ncbi:glyoxalase [Collybia nuda]|uniref:Glyoxalase n=1 Tax=Collybia nuda TaxID=64659 RepID=A0A9P5Y0U0_9AGAR|nr:glyoxalase [Collybia nuda]
MPIHHVGLVVPDLEEGKAFFLAALAPLGYKEFHSFPGLAVGLGISATQADFWLSAGKSPEGGPNKPPSEGLHFAFRAESREVVDQFHEAALKAGGKDNGAPGLRQYAPGYYAAFVHDAKGNNIEVVHM